jgi:hypothetical protein
MLYVEVGSLSAFSILRLWGRVFRAYSSSLIISTKLLNIIILSVGFIICSVNPAICREKRESVSGLSFLKLSKASITFTHLADEHPDQPEPSCEEGQDAIKDELSESVIHNYSLDRFHYMPRKLCEKSLSPCYGLRLYLLLVNDVGYISHQFDSLSPA